MRLRCLFWLHNLLLPSMCKREHKARKTLNRSAEYLERTWIFLRCPNFDDTNWFDYTDTIINQGINTFLLKVLEFILIQNIKVSKLYEFPSCVRFVRKLRRFWKSHSSDTFVCRGNEAYVTVVKLEWSYWSYMRNTLTYKRGAYLYNMRYTYLCRVFSGSKYTCTAFVHVCLCVPSYFENGPGSLVRKRSNLAPIAYLIEWGVGVVNIRPSSRGDLVLIWMGVFEG